MRNLNQLKLKKSIVKGYYALLLLSPVTALGQWSSSPTNASYHLYSIEAVSNNVIYTGGYGGSLLKSVDGGANFVNLSTGYSDWITDIAFLNENYGYISGMSGNTTIQSHLFRTTDGGQSFTVINDSLRYNTMNWLNQNVGFVGCNEGKIIKTTDGGNTWTNIATPSSASISQIQFFDENNGYVLTLDRELLKTVDGGVNWTVYNPPLIECFHFLDMQNGFMADYYGKVGKTSDGGANFNINPSPFNYQMRDIHFLTNDIGFVIGGLDCSSGDCIQKPAILKTVDGGITWTSQNHPFFGTNEGFFQIDFCPNGKGFISGSNTNVLQTSELLSVSEENEIKVNLYPNPSLNKLNIQTPFNTFTVVIYDMQGSLVGSFDCKNSNSTIDISQLSSGSYKIAISNQSADTVIYKSFSKVD